MTDDAILTAAQRAELAAFADVQPGDDDGALLSAVADRIGLTGEMAIDPDGIVELERDGVLVILEAVAEEDRADTELPDALHLGVYLEVKSPAEREAFMNDDLLDGADDDDGGEEWALAWWGAFPTSLQRNAPLSEQMRALHAVMNEAHAVLEKRDAGDFHSRLAWLIHDDELVGDDED